MSLCLKKWLLGAEERPCDRIFLLDGGVSTVLEQSCSGGFEHRELWSSSLLLASEGKKMIETAHANWLASGVNVLSTVTYQCHFEASLWPPKLLAEEKMKQMLQEGIEIARCTMRSYRGPQDRPRFVVASSGCFGAALSNGAEYTGDYGDTTQERIERFHKLKLNQFLTLGVDGVAIETVPSLSECKAIVKVLEELNLSSTKTAIWVSLSCRNKRELNDGSKVEEAINVLLGCSQVDAVGLNCCSIENVSELAKRLTRRVASNNGRRCGIVLYPNSGEIWNAKDATWESGTGCTEPAEMAERLLDTIQCVEEEWRLLKPSTQFPNLIVGGCCRTSPAAIAALRVLVDDHLQQEYKGWF